MLTYGLKAAGCRSNVDPADKGHTKIQDNTASVWTTPCKDRFEFNSNGLANGCGLETISRNRQACKEICTQNSIW